eukprot:CAMPEP_0175643296 /NCGR_PEP_ID=MMETSP0097-20121207/5718_1 /TAXON_ID=311494 /ORGANISM="Alexandrium monilatum, Strain CCMP3105" /LENGTH=58 /DNA_ID=CAMNT_0016949129 /DNA_START=69 /DNA_END=242 /DNA_ORIENTATION=-
MAGRLSPSQPRPTGDAQACTPLPATGPLSVEFRGLISPPAGRTAPGGGSLSVRLSVRP